MAAILDCTEEGSVTEAARLLESGSLVVVPTDTVYGLASAPGVPGAIDKIYHVKARDESKPIVLLVYSIDEVARRGGRLNDVARRLASRFWPGALTVIVDTGDGTQGFRVPNHPVMLGLLELVGGALYVTSANRSGEQPALTASEAMGCLGDEVAAILDAGRLMSGTPSTVVRVTGESVELLREGGVPWQEIEKLTTG